MRLRIGEHPQRCQCAFARFLWNEIPKTDSLEVIHCPGHTQHFERTEGLAVHVDESERTKQSLRPVALFSIRHCPSDVRAQRTSVSITKGLRRIFIDNEYITAWSQHPPHLPQRQPVGEPMKCTERPDCIKRICF